MEIELKYAASPEQGKAILKDLSEDGEAESTYVFVEDDEEMAAVAGVFENMLEDVDLES